MKLKIVSLVLSCLVNGQYSSGDGGFEILEESSTGTIFDDLAISGRDSQGDVEEELISISFAATSGPTRPAQLNNSSRGSTEQSIQKEALASTAYPQTITTTTTTEEVEEEEENTMLVIGLAAGLGALLVVSILTITTCCLMQKRREERQNNTMAKRPVESNPVEQTFERVDFNRQTGNSTRRIKEKNGGCVPNGDQTISELAPSSMGTMRTFVQISNQKPVSHIAIDSDFRNTSSDVDSIESSNATSNNLKPKKNMAQVIEKSAIVAKVNTYGYQELPTREQSSHASYSTSNSSTVPSDHNKIIDQKDANYLPPYETITRSKDSVIDL